MHSWWLVAGVQRVLLVGSPGYRSNGNTTTVGRLWGFTLDGGNGSSTPAFTITGSASAQQGKLGAAVITYTTANDTTTTLAVSAPTYPGGGRVFVLPLAAVPPGDSDVNGEVITRC